MRNGGVRKWAVSVITAKGDGLNQPEALKATAGVGQASEAMAMRHSFTVTRLLYD